MDVREFLRRRLTEKPGEVVNTRGEVIGTHRGVWFYTVGQRGGWELTSKAQRNYAGEGETPVFYVIEKLAVTNRLVVGIGTETYKESFRVEEVNWVSGQEEVEICKYVRIRHGGKLLEVKMKFANEVENSRGDKRILSVELMEAQRGVAPGQSGVFYSEEGVLLGGGVIK